MNWYVMNVINGRERKTKDAIDLALELHNLTKYVNQIVIPKEKYFQVRKGKKVKAERSYYPGYMMIECELNGELIRTVKNVNGVISLLTEPMKEQEVNNMLKKVDELTASDDISFDKTFSYGQSVQIIDGPFAEMKGNISKILEDKKRVVVDVNIFNRKTPVELRYEQVM